MAAMDSLPGIAFQILQSVFVVLAAPLLTGWINQCRAWLQNRSAPSILLPYYTLAKLFHKDAVMARDASPLFRLMPYVLFGCMWLAAGIVPVLATHLPFPPAAAVLMVLLAENARIPIDNPTTHLELTMVHEAMILEYSARHLALVEWAVAIKLFAYMTIGVALFAPWGIAEGGDWAGLPLAVAALAV